MTDRSVPGASPGSNRSARRRTPRADHGPGPALGAKGHKWPFGRGPGLRKITIPGRLRRLSASLQAECPPAPGPPARRAGGIDTSGESLVAGLRPEATGSQARDNQGAS